MTPFTHGVGNPTILALPSSTLQPSRGLLGQESNSSSSIALAAVAKGASCARKTLACYLKASAHQPVLPQIRDPMACPISGCPHLIPSWLGPIFVQRLGDSPFQVPCHLHLGLGDVSFCWFQKLNERSLTMHTNLDLSQDAFSLDNLL